MSHFTVLVIGEDYERQLEPYDENVEVESHDDPIDVAWWSEQLELPEGTSAEEFVAAYNADGENAYVNADGVPCTGSTYNPDSKWDWYQVGGRWHGYFKLKVGAVAMALSDPGVFDNGPLHDADQARKGDVDLEGMREAAGEAAGERWDLFQHLPEPRGV